jgi:tetratricopeptide (TPR) repeat protein
MVHDRRRTTRWRYWIQAGVLILLLLGFGWPTWSYVLAVRDWRSAQHAAEIEDWQSAREHLHACQWLWQYSPSWHLAYARTLRHLGDGKLARQHILQAERLGHDAQAVALEKALLRYQEGDLTAEKDLGEMYQQGPPGAVVEILQVLVPRLLAQFRLPEAGPLSEHWVKLRPESVTAWKYRAQLLERLHPNSDETVAAWRHWCYLAPQDRMARLGLVRLLLQRRERIEEAVTLLEEHLLQSPADEEGRLLLAECRFLQGDHEAALELLHTLMAAGTVQPRAYWLRGRWYLQMGDFSRAVSDLRRAVELDPSHPDAWYNLFQALQQAGAPADQVRQAEERWRQCDQDLRQAGQLARRIGEQPWDPDLRQKLGELFLRNGQETEGLRWLHSALQIRPDHQPTHRTLAEYHQRQGRPDLVAPHRQFLNTTPDSRNSPHPTPP